METPNSLQQYIAETSLSKSAQATLAEDLVAQVKAGAIEPMKAFLQIKAISEVCGQFLKNEEMVNMAMTALNKCGSDVPSYGGDRLGFSSRTSYNYDESHDPEYADLCRQKEIIDKKIKARQMFLQSIDDSIDIVDSETGEMRTIFAPAKTSSKTLRVTFAK